MKLSLKCTCDYKTIMVFQNKLYTAFIICSVIFNIQTSCFGEVTTPVILGDGDVVTISLLNYNTNNASGKVVERPVNLMPYSTVTMNIVQIPTDVSFVLIQAHSYKFSVTLSYNISLVPHFYINGTNVGIVQMNNAGSSIGMQAFISHKTFAEAASVLVTIQAYGKDAPLPGGCNMEFSVETAPYLLLRYSESVIVMEAQPASVSASQSSCSYPSLVELEMYRMYLPERDFSKETYFDSIRKMMTVEGIRKNGQQVPVPVDGPALRRIYSAYPGTGSVYAVIAISGFSASAYVPSLTYACGTSSWDPDTCDVLTTTFSKVLCALAFFLGMFTCFCGHRFFKTEMFLIGFLSGGIVAYILVALEHRFDMTACIDIAVIFGIVTGSIWLLFWRYCGIPVVSVLLATMTLGYVVAAVIMFAGLGDVALLQKDVNFWPAFVCIMLVVPLVATVSIHKANIFTCAVLGGYTVVIPIDHYIGSNLKFIFLNTVRKATVQEFRTAVIDPPFQLRDLLLTVLWVVLALAGTLVQLLQQRGKPPFPPPPFLSRGQRSGRRLQNDAPSERTPLMVDVRIPYGSASDNVFDSPVPVREHFQASAPPYT